MSWRAWRGFVGGLAIVNVGLLVGLLAITRGDAWFTLFEIAARKHSDPAILPYLSELARLLAIPALAAGLVVVLGWRDQPKLSSTSFTSALSALVGAYLLVDLIPVFIARRQQGAAVNGYIGIMWALGFVLALAHREARSRRALTAGVVVYTCIALIAFVPPLRTGVSRPEVVTPTAIPLRTIRSINPAIVAYAQSHLVYETGLGAVSPRATDEVWPHETNLFDVLAAGEPADYFVDALVERRFDAVTPFGGGGRYVAAAGRTSIEYVPALDALIRAGYAPGENGAPPPLLGRRPGQMDLSWARACFSDPHPEACIETGTKALGQPARTAQPSQPK
jgi:hypothetical protein